MSDTEWLFLEIGDNEIGKDHVSIGKMYNPDLKKCIFNNSFIYLLVIK